MAASLSWWLQKCVCLTLATTLWVFPEVLRGDCWEDKDISCCRGASPSPRKLVSAYLWESYAPEAPATDLSLSLTFFLSLFPLSSNSPPVSLLTKMRTQLIQAKWGRRRRRRRRRRPREPSETESKQEKPNRAACRSAAWKQHTERGVTVHVH